MIFFSTHTRSPQSEIMDDFSLQGTEMESLLTDLKRVNTLLGGIRITTNGIKMLLKFHPKDKKVRIVDVGCGDGELLRQCALWGRKNKFHFELIGVDANPHILKEAQARSKAYPEIEYRVLNIFSDEIKTLTIDICLCKIIFPYTVWYDCDLCRSDTIVFELWKFTLSDSYPGRSIAYNSFAHKKIINTFWALRYNISICFLEVG